MQTGQLIEDFFPRNGVRYIVMNDGIDTMRDNNDIALLKKNLRERNFANLPDEKVQKKEFEQEKVNKK